MGAVFLGFGVGPSFFRASLAVFFLFGGFGRCVAFSIHTRWWSFPNRLLVKHSLSEGWVAFPGYGLLVEFRGSLHR